jgi:tetratricopeptide (TPR) repeat protein
LNFKEEKMKKNLPKLVLTIAVLLTISIVFASCQKERPIRLFYECRNYYTENNYEEAIYCLNTVIKIDPEYAEAYFIRAHTYYEMKNYEEAIADFTRCIDYNPNHAEAYYWRGAAYYDLDDYNNAISNYSKAIELDPDNTYYYNSRGSSYYLRDKGNDISKSIDDYRKGCRLGDNYSCDRLEELLEE